MHDEKTLKLHCEKQNFDNLRFCFSQSHLQVFKLKWCATKLLIENIICGNWILSGRSLRFKNSGRMMEESYFTLFFKVSINCRLFTL